MKRLLIAALIGAGILASNATATADPWCSNPYTCNQPTPPFNGQLQPTWDNGYWGGWTTDQIQCNPMVHGGQCGPFVPNPNGGP